MDNRSFPWTPVLGTVALASLLWFVTFYLTWLTFWIKISFSAALLAVLSLLLQPDSRPRLKMDARSAALGLVSAAVLYAVFWAGKAVSTLIFPFAATQIGAVYGKGDGTPLWVIAALLFCVTGPAEEIFWRGYLQRMLSLRFGGWKGCLLATCVYAGVHIWSFNFMLVGAAAVAGAFWGIMYWRTQSLAPVIVSHSLWSTVIFAIFPLR